MSEPIISQKTFLGLSLTPGESFRRAHLYTLTASPGGTKRGMTTAAAVLDAGLLERLEQLPLHSDISATIEQRAEARGMTLCDFAPV